MDLDTKAKLQFIRTLDRLVEDKDITWMVVGQFVKNMILQETQNTFEPQPLEIVFRPTNVFKFDKIIHDLFIMDFVVEKQYKPGGCFTIVKIKNYLFECVFYENKYKCFMASDQIVLTSKGLTLINFTCYTDPLNITKGVALAQRLCQLQAKQDTLLMYYFNIPENQFIRAKNAVIMKKHVEALEAGFTVKGSLILRVHDATENCPICLDKKKFHTTLTCTHQFCVNCLAKHMELPDECNSRCPMCRRLLMMNLEAK